MKKGVKKDKKKSVKKIKPEKIPEKKIEIKEEKNLEEEVFEGEEEISDSSFRGFLQPLVSRRTAPVLERVAVNSEVDLEQQLANVATGKKDEESQISYGSNKVDYGTTREHRRDVVKYEGEGPKYGDLGKDKKDEEKNRLISPGIKGEWKVDEREERWQMEGQKSFEEETPEKKYLAKGQY